MSDPIDLPAIPELPEGVDPAVITRALAAAAHPQIINDLALRAGDNTISTTSLLAISEHLYKVSGASAKAEQKVAGPGFSIQIVLGGGSQDEKVINIGPSTGFFDEIPDFMEGSGGNLADFTE